MRFLPALALSTLMFAASHAAAVGSAQLVAVVDQNAAYVNGDAVRLSAPPRIIGGRTMLPLREVAQLLDQDIIGAPPQLQLGRLIIDTRKPAVALNGAPQPASVANVGNVLYISAKLLADGVQGNVSFSDDGRTLTLTALRGGGNPLAPQARFSTDKTVYAPGERVVYTEYAFDPDGADIVSRKWLGRQDAFFAPGTYTVTLQVTNARGLSSDAFSRTIRVEGPPMDTPLTYALKYAQPGDTFSDPNVLRYPALAPQSVTAGPTAPLLFSDSPEAPTQSGVLYQDSITGRARTLAYHINGLRRPARLYVLARNTESRPVELRSERLGETAPTRIEGLLGQVTLLEYFANSGTTQIVLQPGETAAAYASPTLNPGSGVNVMQDLNVSGRVELTFVMLEDGLAPTQQVVQQLPYLAPDGRHQRGTFPDAVRTLRVNLTQFPARLVIGDGNIDPATLGTDVLTGTPQRLVGNYGVLYDLEVTGAAGTAVALSPRGGLYRGAMQITDGPLQQVIKLPRAGIISNPDQPALLWRTQSDRMDIDFVPASGSNLPISLVFYRSGAAGTFGSTLKKTYNP
ncbi:stalk domain-containing protein [Deinococcus maricopensis]|uniref:Copper amine oxidase-like domain-containing protein n=1 Tax=Deinococcus maricopensis (strain DSM 21211 / LMG 22137 / NRRL B-23946 / LB-34) TaxID=709986 RepID=E8U6L1_DEIML|nr:stalk domain-containing protein [Deinococcus maricopensis]ADV66700.1 copper amine oxidase-like domain-containing protein [Deinococcus maricopensis DSM 21211]